ncbi:hypothetical protein HDU82_002039, partial [Entophlyctis luteolus]
MALQSTFADAACQFPIALAFFDADCSPVTKCTAMDNGFNYYQTECVTSGSFQDAADNTFGEGAYADSTIYASTNCAGAVTGYEADLYDACIAVSSTAAFMRTATQYYAFASATCSDAPTASAAATSSCYMLAGGGSAQLVNAPFANSGSSSSTSNSNSSSGSYGGTASLVAQGSVVSAAAVGTPPNTNTSSSALAGPIVGGIVGCVAVVAAVAFCVWSKAKRRTMPESVNPIAPRGRDSAPFIAPAYPSASKFASPPLSDARV